MNVVMNKTGDLIEIQGTAEGHVFSRDELNQMLDLAEKGINEIIIKQNKALNYL
jgi:ribonuclease PH